MKRLHIRLALVGLITAVALLGFHEHAVAKKRFGFDVNYGFIDEVCRDGAEVGVEFRGSNTNYSYTYHAELVNGQRISEDITFFHPGTGDSVIIIDERLEWYQSIVPGTEIVINARNNYINQTQRLMVQIEDCSLASDISYHGRLSTGNQPAQGVYDFAFQLFDTETNGNQIGGTVERLEVPVIDGIFEVSLDFGYKVFDSNPKWMEIAVRQNGAEQYTALNPRQQILPAPYALFAANTPQHDHTGETWESSEPLAISGGGIVVTDPYNTANRVTLGGNYLTMVQATSNSSGATVELDNSGGGTALRTTANTAEWYTPVVDVWNHGRGGAVEATSSVSSTAPTMSVTNYGSNNAIYARSWLSTTVNPTIYVDNYSNYGAGLYVNNRGNDAAGVVVFSKQDSALFASNNNSLGEFYATVYASNSASGGYAGRFRGNVHISGTLSKSAGSFKIDHPLDPANQYLNHSFVESPDMMNVYNGNVQLDANGEAVVTMPAWFEAINREFRYQLTPIGGPGPNLYVAQEISGNQFKIAGGAPGLKVSWQVTGIRHDPYAEANRIPVEEMKPPQERGTYLFPELYGMPKQYGLDYVQTQQRAAAVSAGIEEQSVNEPSQ